MIPAQVKITRFEQLYPEDLRLIDLMRQVGFGEVVIKLRNGKPVIVERAIQTIKLEG